METIIFDLDKTLCTKKKENETYMDVQPIQEMIDVVNELYDKGYEIIIETARNMVTQNNNEAKVIGNVGLVTLEWLKKYNVKYHGIKFGKTYGICYVDDKAIRPNELLYLQKTNRLDNISEYLKNMNKIDYFKENN